MQFNKSTLLAIVASAQFALAAYVPSEPWTTLTPTASYLSGAITDYPSTFGIAVSRVATASESTGVAKRGLVKRDVATQITDGQVQATTGTEKTTKAAATQIGDGQVQATTGTAKATEAAATQIGDGQVQATTGTEKTTAVAATQIGDGQVQATTGTAKTTKAAVTQIGDGQVQATTGTAKTTEAAVTQIGDGQVQATTGTAKATKAAVSQIGDGQVQATTATAKTATAASQIGDGQVQATTGSTATKGAASQITDGQVQATASSSAQSSDGQITDEEGDSVSDPVDTVSCYSDDTLALTLKNSVLEDAHSRIGSIVANHQFQFDGPTPQAGAIYAAGWSITEDGLLAIGNSTKFYECLSGTFYNLYDEDIGSVCYEIVLQVVDLVDC